MGLLQVGEAQLMAWLASFAWPFVRISALLVAAPMFGARTVPVRVRAALAALLAFIVAPMFPASGEIEIFSLAGAIGLAREVLIGVALGFLLQMMFAAISMAGEIIALSTGLAFATVMDPERGGAVPLISQYFTILATLLFLAFDGHLALLTLLIQSFGPLPPGASGFGATDLWSLVGWGTQMYETAVWVALPAAAAMLLANVCMGLVARSAPQLNIFAVGFPMTLMLGLVFLLLSMPSLAPQVSAVMDQVLDLAAGLVGLPGGALWSQP